MSSPFDPSGHALAAHELYANEHIQYARNVKEGLGSYFPLKSDRGRLEMNLIDVEVDRSKDPASEPGFLARTRYEGESYQIPVRATFELTKDGKVVSKATKRIGYYYPVAEGLGARLIGGSIYQNRYQIRRKPGVYPFRNARTSLVEFNTNHGQSFNLAVDPKGDGVPRLDLVIPGSSPIRFGVYTILRMFGYTDSNLKSLLGDYHRYNAFQTKAGEGKDGPPVDLASVAHRIIKKIIPEYQLEVMLTEKGAGSVDSLSFEAASNLFQEWAKQRPAFDEGVAKDTIGVKTAFIDKQSLYSATSKLLAIHQGDEEPDHRFAEKYRKLHGIPTQIREGFILDKKLSRSIKGNIKGKLDQMEDRLDRGEITDDDLSVGSIVDSTRNAIGSKLKSAFTESELSSTTETNNVLDIDTRSKEVTIKGPGGIRSKHAISPDTIYLHPSRLGLTDFLKTQAGAPGETVPLANGAAFSESGEVHRLLYDRKLGKARPVSSEEADKGGVGFPDDFQVKRNKGGEQVYTPKNKEVFAAVGEEVKRVPEKEVRYILLDMTHAFSDTVNLVPFLNHNSGPRAIFGSNQMTQALSLSNPEPPLVRTIDESGNTFTSRIGKRYNVLAKVNGQVTEVNKDQIVIRESGTRKKISHSLLRDFPLNQGAFIDQEPVVSVGQKVKKGELLTKNNYTDDSGELAIGSNLRVAYATYKGYNFEDGIVMSESAASKMTSRHMDEFVIPKADHYRRGVNGFESTFAIKNRNIPNRGDIDPKTHAVKEGATLKQGDMIAPIASDPYLQNRRDISDEMEAMLSRMGAKAKDESIRWDKPYPGTVVKVEDLPTEVRVYVKSEQKFKEGDKLSAFHGNKGIVSKIIPDKDMPKTPDGTPIEVLIDPHGIPSRANPGQVYELAASRIAKQTGKPYLVHNFHSDNAKRIMDDLAKMGIKDKEHLTIPGPNGEEQTVEPVAWGYQYLGKLKHQLDKKYSVRNMLTDGYDMNQQPVGGAAIDNLTVYALIGHNARANLSEIARLKGTENADFWREMAAGGNPTSPTRVPFTFERFDAVMKGLGVNMEKRSDGHLTLTPLTDKDILHRSAGEVRKSRRFGSRRTSAGPQPFKNGLFDESLMGSEGNNWTHIDLSEPMPNPLFEKAVVLSLKYGLPSDAKIKKASGKWDRMNNMANSDLQSVFVGDQSIKLNGKEYTGGEGIKELLKGIDQKQMEKDVRDQLQKAVAPGKKNVNASKASELYATLRHVSNLNDKKIDISEAYMTSKVPVIPLKFRQAIIRSDWQMSVPPSNDLYASLIGQSNDLKAGKSEYLPENDIKDMRRKTYQAYGALLGAQGFRPIGKFQRPPQSLADELAKPTAKAGTEDFGVLDRDGGAPKDGYIQKRIVKKKVELSGRSTIVPTGTVPTEEADDLDVDEVGMPEEMAWKVYQPFIRNSLSKTYGATRATQMITNRDPAARMALESEVKNRYALVNRAPSWWPYNMMALKPVIIWGEKGDKDGVEKEKALRIPNLIVNSYFGGDYDGDAMSVTIPAEHAAVEEAKRLLPSNHLKAPGSGRLMITPDQSQILGLYFLTRTDLSKPPKPAPQGVGTVKQLALAFESGMIPRTEAGQRYFVAGQEWTPGWALVDESIRYATGNKFGVEEVIKRINEKDDTSITRQDFVLKKSHLNKKLMPMLAEMAPEHYTRITQRLVRAGDDHATRHGLSIGVSDLQAPQEWINKTINDADKLVPTLAKQLAKQRGERMSDDHINEARTTLMTFGKDIEIGEGKNKKVVQSARVQIENGLKDMDTDNAFIRMMQIGSKGSETQVRQILGALLNVNDVRKGIVPEVIKGNFATGLKGGEYFLQQHGALSGLRDRAVETSAPGYLGKKIILSSQEMVISEHDCKTQQGRDTPVLKDGGNGKMVLAERDFEGRFEAGTNREITTPYLQEMRRAGKEVLKVRSPLYCRAKVGVCQMCYGKDEISGQFPPIGDNVGVRQGQSIVEQSTKMTLKAFHTSGSADKAAPSFDRLEEIVELKSPLHKALVFEGPRGSDVRLVSVDYQNSLFGKKGDKGVRITYEIQGPTPQRKVVEVKPGMSLKPEVANQTKTMFKVGDPITEGNLDPADIAEFRGRNNMEGFKAQRDFVADELHGIFDGLGAGFSRRTSETAVASMAAYVIVRDPGDSNFFPYDKVKIGEVIDFNDKAKKTGKRPIKFDRQVMGVHQVPLEGENWLAKLNFQNLKSSIIDAGVHGRSADLHGPNPISAYMYGAEFGKGRSDWSY